MRIETHTESKLVGLITPCALWTKLFAVYLWFFFYQDDEVSEFNGGLVVFLLANICANMGMKILLPYSLK